MKKLLSATKYICISISIFLVVPVHTMEQSFKVGVLKREEAYAVTSPILTFSNRLSITYHTVPENITIEQLKNKIKYFGSEEKNKCTIWRPQQGWAAQQGSDPDRMAYPVSKLDDSTPLSTLTDWEQGNLFLICHPKQLIYTFRIFLTISPSAKNELGLSGNINDYIISMEVSSYETTIKEIVDNYRENINKSDKISDNDKKQINQAFQANRFLFYPSDHGGHPDESKKDVVSSQKPLDIETILDATNPDRFSYGRFYLRIKK